MICDCSRLSSSDKVKDLILSLFFLLLSSENKFKKSIDSVFLYANMPRIESDMSVVGCIG